MTINILFPNPANPLIVPKGEFVGCWIAWSTVIEQNSTWSWRRYRFPKYAAAATLANLLATDPERIFSVDVILRSIAQSYNGGAACNVAQAMGAFVHVNAIDFVQIHSIGLAGINVGGVSLSNHILGVWDGYSKQDKLKYLRFGIERLEWVLNYTGINLNSLIYRANYYNP